MEEKTASDIQPRGRGRPRKFKPDGPTEVYVEPEALQEKPIVLTQHQANMLLKSIKPPKPRSEAQKANALRLGQLARERFAKLKTEKEALAQEKARLAEEAKKKQAKILVKPKKKRAIKPKPISIPEDQEEEEEEEEDEDDSIQVVKKSSNKAKELVEQVTEIDNRINALRSNTSGNRYDSLVRF